MNIKLNPLIVVGLFFFCTIKPISANTTTFTFLQVLLNFYTLDYLDDQTLVMDEICDNGIDDDNDGFYDAFDPDCQCKPALASTNLIANSNFEDITGPCSFSVSQQNNWLADWKWIGGSPDYFSPNCNLNNPWGGFDGLPNNSILTLAFATNSTIGRSEAIGTCFKEPLLPNNTYALAMDVVFLDLVPSNDEVFFTVYGIKDCTDLDNIMVPGDHELEGCETGIAIEELHTFTVNQLPDATLQTITAVISNLPNNMEGLILAGTCGQTTSQNASFKLMFDNISITPFLPADWDYQEEIEQVGAICTSDSIRLVVPFADSLTFQWYKDSIPLINEKNNELTIYTNNNTDFTGNYQLNVIAPNGDCQIVQKEIAALPQQVINTAILLCDGTSYQFGDTTITSAGNYTQTFAQTENDCDSIVNLSVTYIPALTRNIEVTIQPNETYDFDGQQITIPGIYRDTIPNLIGIGCDSIITLNLMVTGTIAENCNDGLDNDGDGLIDAFDEDCQCQTLAENLVVNGDFESFEAGCCTQSTAGAPICIDNWPLQHSTPDFIHRACLWRTDEELEAIYGFPVESNSMGILIQHAVDVFMNPIIPIEEGMESETIGQCLEAPMMAGKTYLISIDVAKKNKLQGGDLIEDIFFTLNGIPNCDSLFRYSPDIDFCKSGLTYEKLAAANLFTLNPGWNHFEFEFIPSTDLAAIFVSGDCDLMPKGLNTEIALIDNISIQEKIDLLSIPNEIKVTGNPCDENNMLVFAVEQVAGASYQWYLDSVPQLGSTTANRTFDLNTDTVGIHHVNVTFPDGHCELIGPYDFVYQTPNSRDTITICSGSTILVGGNVVSFEGEFTDTFPSLTDGCDSTATLVVLVEELNSTYITDTIVEGASYDFNGNSIVTTGMYRDTLLTMRGCDSILILELMVNPPEEENLCANSFEVTVEWSDVDCETAGNGQIVLQTVNGTEPFQYSIDGGNNFSGQTIFSNLSIGTYDIVVMDNNGCLSTNFVNINESTSTLFLELPADTFLFEGQSINLAIKESNFTPISYDWSSDVAVIHCSNCPSIRINPVESGVFTLTVTDKNGCQITEEVIIEVKPIPQLYIPSVFSPNGDGLNDVFKIQGLPEVVEQVAELQIFNRWGNLVYQQQKSINGTSLEWDGLINNKIALIDVYMYVISWQNQRGEQEILTGDFTLVR